MMAQLVVSIKKNICQKRLHLVSVYSVAMRCSRCGATTSSLSSKINYPLANDNDPLCRLEHKDWLAPNEVFKIFKSLNDPGTIIHAFKKVSERKDYKPNEALYSLMFEKLARAQDFNAIEDLLGRIKSEKCRVSEEFFYRLIKIYGNVASNPERAIKTLFRMPDYHCWPTIKTFNFVLNMLVNAKQFDVIHEIYLGAPCLGVTVDTCCFNILIKGLCQCDKLDAAFALLSEFPKQGCKPNTKTYSTLMHSLCNHNRLGEAFELLKRMEQEGCNPDTITFNILISGLCKQGEVANGLELLDKMRLKGCNPNSGSYQALLYGLLSSGDYIKANNFFSRMLSEGIFPSFLSYKMLIEGLCNQNLLNDVHFVLKQMVQQGFVPRMGTWKKILETMYLRMDCYTSLAHDINSMQPVK